MTAKPTPVLQFFNQLRLGDVKFKIKIILHYHGGGDGHEIMAAFNNRFGNMVADSC